MQDPRINVRLTPKQHEQLKMLCAKRGKKINQFLQDYIISEIEADRIAMNNKIESGARVLSLFANIGVAEAYFDKIGISVVLANELIERRAE